jgi:SAM-dependent methyltransferase
MMEAFKPIPVRALSENRIAFFVRCIFDLQLLTVYKFLRRRLADCHGKVLDVGAGQAPWRGLLPGDDYVGLDIESASNFGMTRVPGVIYYDGSRMPFSDASFDHILCSEVLEHVPDAGTFMAELARVIRANGTIVLTVPWSARLHHLPHDYRRLTRQGLKDLFSQSGFTAIRIEERGNDVAVIANKLIVVIVRKLRPRKRAHLIWTWALVLALAPVASAFLVASHVSMLLGLGSREDPLGYGVVATKRSS